MGPLSSLDHLVVLSDHSDPSGGAEIMAIRSAQQMAETGVPVTFITGDDGKQCPLDRSKIRVIALGESSIAKNHSIKNSVTGLYNFAVKNAIVKFIADHDTPSTIYHLHNWTKIFSPSIFQALQPVSSRLFLSAHDFSLVCPTLSYSNYQDDDKPCTLAPLGARCLATHCDQRSYVHKLWRVTRAVERRMFMDIGATRSSVGVIHPDLVEYFTRGGIPSDRLRVVRNPVTPFATSRIAAEANQDLFFIGRVVHEKGIDLAAGAAQLAGRRLRVIGDGELRASLERKFPDVVFEGWRSHDQIAELIQDARGLIVSSRIPERFTLVAHEAMRSGIPVVAFSDVDCGEAAEIGGAIAVPPREVSSLAAGLRQLDDDDAVKRISQIAFTEGARFSNTNETWLQAMAGHYSELLEQSRLQMA